MNHCYRVLITFGHFFDFKKTTHVTGPDGPGKVKKVWRGYTHSFWHDHPTDDGTHERYGRRFPRFFEIDAHLTQVLFIRHAADQTFRILFSLVMRIPIS